MHLKTTGPMPAEQDGIAAAGISLRRRRLSRPAMLSLVTLTLAFAGLGLWLIDAWGETARREVFLPQLEVQARRSPDDGPLLALLGARLAESHEQQAAAETLRRSLAAGEQSEIVYQTLAASQAALGRRDLALADLRLGQKSLSGGAPALDAALERAQALGPNPNPPTLAQAIGPDGPALLVSTYTQGSFLNGVVSWWGRQHPDRSGFATRRQWAHDEPGDAQAQRLWGRALLMNRRAPEAAAVLTDAAALAPHSPAMHLALAQALEAERAVGKADVEYIAALNLRPDWPPALLGLGRTSLQSGLKYARQAFTRTTQLAPDSASAWAGLGSACLQNDSDLRQSLRAFQEAARLAPDRTDFDDDYGEALRKNGRPDEAEALLRRRLAVAPDDAVCHYRLGGLLMENVPSPARMADAETQTGEALRLLPHQAGAERQLGTILLDEGHLPAALHITLAAVADDPYEVQARHVLAQIYGRLGQPAQAGQVSARAAQLFSLQQRANVLENQRQKRFLEAAYHQDLVRVYQLTGQQGKATQEEQMLSLLRRDPQGAALSYRDYQASLARALGGAVQN